MNLETRKIKFVPSFCKLENEAAVAYLEQTLMRLKNDDIQPMMIDELNNGLTNRKLILKMVGLRGIWI